MRPQRRNRRIMPTSPVARAMLASIISVNQAEVFFEVNPRDITPGAPLSGITLFNGGVFRPCTAATRQIASVILTFAGPAIADGDTITFNNQGGIVLHVNAHIPRGHVIQAAA